MNKTQKQFQSSLTFTFDLQMFDKINFTFPEIACIVDMSH